MVIEKVLPAIKSKMQFMKSRRLFIQKDNAKPHILIRDELFFETATSDGWDTRIKNQPANSPDINTCDFGFFNKVRSIQQEKFVSLIDELSACVEDAFNEVEPNSLYDNFIALQAVFREILRGDGGKDFKIPHLKKQYMR